MRFSLLISILIHVVLLWVLLTLFRIVPEMRLPEKIYQVKILQPIMRSRQPEPEQKSEAETPVVEEKEKPAEVKPKEKKKKPEPKRETKPQTKEKPLDVSMEKEAEDGTSIAVEGERFPFSYYLSAIERKVSKNWFSGVSSESSGYSCVVYFRLRKDGRIEDLGVEQSSGNSYFDRSATRAIRSAAPFPPLPRAFSDEVLGIHYTFAQRD
jgi:TonB family protein